MSHRAHNRNGVRILCALCVLCGGLRAADFTPEQISFYEKQVKPLLAGNCIGCHGPKKVKGKLRLDSYAGLMKGGEQGAVFDAKNPEKSLLLAMISYKDDNHQMPPDGKLKQGEIDTLTQWVKMGVPYDKKEAAVASQEHAAEPPKSDGKDWWAYQSLTRPPVPAVKNTQWVKNPIDAFILSGLEKKELKPVSAAEKATLCRRAYYDLIGLPPTPQQLNDFVSDKNTDAYEKLIDKLLASPQYGEKWGRYWLDLVRFAETNGYERDGAKPYAWRYRDYVIRAFNEDKPYDQFIREQVAGDELDQVTPDSIMATGFYRLGIWDDEPADRKLSRYDGLDGTLSTMSNAFLATTIGCARCHDHKKDPLPQKDYYSMLAFIHDVSDGHTTNITREIISPEAQAEYDRKLRDKLAREDELHKETARIEEEFRAAAGKKSETAKPSAPLLPDSRVEGQIWSYTTNNPGDNWIKLDFDEKNWKQGPGGFGTNSPGAKTRTDWKTPDIWMRKKFEIKELPKQLSMDLHHDEDCEVYINGGLIRRFSGHLIAYESIPLSAENLKTFKVGPNIIAVHCKQTAGGQYIDVGLSNPADLLNVAVMIRKEGEQVLGKEKTDRYFGLKTQLDASRKMKLDSSALVAMAVFEHKQPNAKVLLRGNPHLEGDEVQPAFPPILDARPVVIPPPKSGAKTNGRRRVLADWLASKENKLTARVMANRLWQFHFGRGIVRTPNDFGQLGEKPTHPELLDWLASEFMSREWKIKSMHRLIMTSNTYQMSCAEDAADLAKDPANDSFWRFDMRRLSAEEVRDSILAVNGTLNPKMGGPSIYTEVPIEVLQTSSQPKNVWGKSPPDEQTRRSVYIFVKRSLVEPILNTFDFADTDSSCPARFATTVPTQSLTSLNSKFFNDAAANLAKRLRAEAGPDEPAQVKLALRLALGREPKSKEVSRGINLMQRLRKEDGVAPEKTLDYFCLVVLNMNEFIYLE